MDRHAFTSLRQHEPCSAFTPPTPTTSAPAEERSQAFRGAHALALRTAGMSLKAIAFELGLSPSSTCRILKRERARRGLPRRGLAGVVPEELLAERLADVCRPLSPAEAEVVWHLAHGRDSRWIARTRARSLRTIANQIGQAYRKLRISGHAELLALLGASSPPATVEG